ncbi:MAG: hypothetical protein ACU0DI_16150, partial [Paracoccaceae bacterium]
WQARGKAAEARDLLAPIYDWFTEVTSLQPSKSIGELSPLSGLDNSEELDLCETRITDVSPLSGLGNQVAVRQHNALDCARCPPCIDQTSDIIFVGVSSQFRFRCICQHAFIIAGQRDDMINHIRKFSQVRPIGQQYLGAGIPERIDQLWHGVARIQWHHDHPTSGYPNIGFNILMGVVR